MVMLETSIEGKFLWMENYSHHKFSSRTTSFLMRPVIFLILSWPKAEKPQNGTVPQLFVVPWGELKS